MDLKRNLAASGMEKGRTQPCLPNKELNSKQGGTPKPPFKLSEEKTFNRQAQCISGPNLGGRQDRAG